MGYLRFYLSIIVVMSHLSTGAFYGHPEVNLLSVGPINAVRMFFIISGFYMAMVFYKYSSPFEFYLSRALRLYPIYWLTLVVTIAIAFILHETKIGGFIDLTVWFQGGSLFAKALLFLSNFSFFGLDLSYFYCVGANHAQFALMSWSDCPTGYLIGIQKVVLDPPAWTLALELYFYLLVPIFFVMKIRAVIAIAIFSVALTLFIMAIHLPHHDILDRVFFPAELYLFLIGFLAYKLKNYINRSVGLSCSLLSLMLILIYNHIPVANIGSLYIWQDLLLFGIFTLALPTLFKFGEHIPGERFIGDLSYPIYISHTCVLSLIYYLGTQHFLNMWAWVMLNLISVIIFSFSLLLMSRPCESLRHHLFPAGRENSRHPSKL